MIYMQHPEHGAMHVLTDSEAATAEKNGWARAEWPPAPKATQTADLAAQTTEQLPELPTADLAALATGDVAALSAADLPAKATKATTRKPKATQTAD